MTQKNEITMKATPPSSCNGCGNKPGEKDKGWLMFNMGFEGVLFFSCPKCGAVFVCQEAEKNLNILDKLRRKQAKKQEPSRIILPH